MIDCQKRGLIKETTLDKFGRIVISKQVRDDSGLKPGDVLRIKEVEEDISSKNFI